MLKAIEILAGFQNSAESIAKMVDSILGENGIEEFSPYSFSMIGEEFDVIGNGDYSLVIKVGPKSVAKIMTDKTEFELLSKIMKEPVEGLPEVHDVGKHLDVYVAIVKEYYRLPFEWRKALLNGIHESDISDYETIAKEMNLTPKSVEVFDNALEKLDEWGIQLKDWKPDNLMWDTEGGFPVLTDLGQFD